MMKKLLVGLIVLGLSSSAVFAISGNPVDIGMGARPLGMGRTFVGVAGASNNQYINPAGLYGIYGLNLNTMSGRLLQEVNYMTAGIAHAGNYGAIALGFVNAGMEDIPITRLTPLGTIEAYDSTSYYNSVAVLSYAAPVVFVTDRIGFLPKFGFANDLSFGTNLKLFLQGFSNKSGVMDGASGTGFDMDFGLLYSPKSPISLGVSLQNGLPFDMGGKFTWDANDEEEGIPAVLKIGGTVQLLGANGLRQLGNHKLLLAVDNDMYIKAKRPGVWHAGLEWWPVKFLALRVGLDQQTSTVQVDSNMTAGLGLKFGGFTFDYAYHEYGDISDNTTHYFSLGYGIEAPEKEKVRKLKKKLKWITFIDVTEGYWSKFSIEALATAGVIQGYPDRTYRPERTISRAEVATLLMRARGLGAKKVTATSFPDMKASHWAAQYVEAAVSLNILQGYPDGTFKPNNSITRAEMTKILVLFDGLKTSLPRSSVYPDVKVDHWAAQYIKAARDAGIIEFIKNGNFQPNKKLNRAEAAEMIAKTKFGKAQIAALFE